MKSRTMLQNEGFREAQNSIYSLTVGKASYVMAPDTSDNNWQGKFDIG